MTTISQIERVYAARHRARPYRRNVVIVKCCICGRTKIGKNLWAYVQDSGEDCSHGFCPPCFTTRRVDVYESEIKYLRGEVTELKKRIEKNK